MHAQSPLGNLLLQYNNILFQFACLKVTLRGYAADKPYSGDFEWMNMQEAFASKELSALITFSSLFPQLTVDGRPLSE